VFRRPGGGRGVRRARTRTRTRRASNRAALMLLWGRERSGRRGWMPCNGERGEGNRGRLGWERERESGERRSAGGRQSGDRGTSCRTSVSSPTSSQSLACTFVVQPLAQPRYRLQPPLNLHAFYLHARRCRIDHPPLTCSFKVVLYV
jgi:hypothetical protein